MKLQLQIPLTGQQYSRNQIELDNPTDEEIRHAFLLMQRADDIMMGLKEGTISRETTAQTSPLPTGKTIPLPSVSSWMEFDVLKTENAQLKASQDKAMQFFQILQYKNPELYEEILTAVDAQNAEHAAEQAVDEKLLEKDS